MVYNGILPIVEYILFKGTVHINSEFNIGWLFTRSFFYPLMGYYCNTKIRYEKFKGKIGVLLGVDFFV